jgi:hypothetical protein
MHIFIMSKIRHSHRQYDTRKRHGTKHKLNQAKVWPAGHVLVHLQKTFCLRFQQRRCSSYPMPKGGARRPCVPGLSGLLGVAQARKLYRNPYRFDGVFQALVRSSAEALPVYPLHYLGAGDLPIIVSHSFASLMLFVH